MAVLPPHESILTSILTNLISLCTLFLITYITYTALSRLYFSPLSHFPGPKLAALTWYYQIYHDIYPHYGQYYKHIAHLHTIYGPIIRINPHELHVSDPEFFEVLYSTHEKRDKWSWLTHTFGMPESTFATTDHVVHRRRRAALNPWFSKASVLRLQPVVDERVELLLRRLRDAGREGTIVDVAEVMSAFSTDVIMTYAFGKSHNRLEMPDYGRETYVAGHEGGLLGPVMMHFKFILYIIQSLPNSIVKSLGPAMAAFVELRQGFEKQVTQVLQEKGSFTTHDHPTIFHSLLQSKLPFSDLTSSRLSDEALSLISAGNETVSWALTVAFHHILSSPAILQTLQKELRDAGMDENRTIKLSELENLPYLNAIFKESLRLSYGMSCRLQRIPHQCLVYTPSNNPVPNFNVGSVSSPPPTSSTSTSTTNQTNPNTTNPNFTKQYIIPSSTPISMTSMLMHHNEDIFPSSHTFKPERWLTAEHHNLARYMVSFGKGSRGCVGRDLALAEFLLVLAGVFGRFEGVVKGRVEKDRGGAEVVEGKVGTIELVDGDVRDVAIWADRVIPAVWEGSQGVRIRVRLRE